MSYWANQLENAQTRMEAAEELIGLLSKVESAAARVDSAVISQDMRNVVNTLGYRAITFRRVLRDKVNMCNTKLSEEAARNG
jgi:hypothetical protein